MYVQPSTNIKLLAGVPLDNTQEHTIYFETEPAQRSYFQSKAKKNLTSQTFQRVDRGVARLQVPIGDIYDCNYMMFQNSLFSSKWFYAFVTSVEYINNEVSEIRFEIDYHQTWLFDYELKECYIDRQHTETDAIGDNIVPEPVALGEYVFNKRPAVSEAYQRLNFPNANNTYDYSTMAVIIAIVDVRGTASQGNIYDGIYGAAELWAYKVNDFTAINDKITSYLQSPDSILSIYMVPLASIVQVVPDGGVKLLTGTKGASSRHVGVALTGYEQLDGYVPRNKKLYTYPFNYFQVDNGSGRALSLRYEFFEDLRPYLITRATITQPVQVALWPAGYKNAGQRSDGALITDEPLLTESLELNNFPMCSWNVDTYKAWVAQSSVPLALDTAAAVGQTAISATFSTNPAAAAASGGLSIVSNMLSQAYANSIAADMCKGAFNNGGVNCASGYQTFYGGRVSITADMAKRIDDFMDYFGYQINELRVPNRAARPHWTYIKTASCVLSGGVPNDDMQRIIESYNRGITWWRSGAEVGNYSLDNRAV